MKIYRIVLTGGPGAGKTTGAERIRKVFENNNVKVFTVPETAAELYQGGILPQKYVNDPDFETCFLRFQIEKENTYIAAAAGLECDTVLIIYDRGALDSKGYLPEKVFACVLENMDLSETELLARYDAVIHMVTSAYGEEDLYKNVSDEFRNESIRQAIALDKSLADAWKDHPHFITIGFENDVEVKMDHLISEIQAILEG